MIGVVKVELGNGALRLSNLVVMFSRDGDVRLLVDLLDMLVEVLVIGTYSGPSSATSLRLDADRLGS